MARSDLSPHGTMARRVRSRRAIAPGRERPLRNYPTAPRFEFRHTWMKRSAGGSRWGSRQHFNWMQSRTVSLRAILSVLGLLRQPTFRRVGPFRAISTWNLQLTRRTRVLEPG